MTRLVRCLARHLAKSYERRVVKRLRPLQSESDKIIGEVSALPGKFAEVDRTVAKLGLLRASIFKDLKELAVIPRIIMDILENIAAGADVLDLEVDEEALQ